LLLAHRCKSSEHNQLVARFNVDPLTRELPAVIFFIERSSWSSRIFMLDYVIDLTIDV